MRKEIFLVGSILFSAAIFIAGNGLIGTLIPVRAALAGFSNGTLGLIGSAYYLGFVAGWVTGWRTYSERVREAFAGPGERIAGFIFIGHPVRELEERERPPLSDVWTAWETPKS